MGTDWRSFRTIHSRRSTGGSSVLECATNTSSCRASPDDERPLHQLDDRRIEPEPLPAGDDNPRARRRKVSPTVILHLHPLVLGIVERLERSDCGVDPAADVDFPVAVIEPG